MGASRPTLYLLITQLIPLTCLPVMGGGRFLLPTVRRGGRLALGSSWVEVGAGLGSSGLVRRGGVLLRIYLAEESREIDSANMFGRPFYKNSKLELFLAQHVFFVDYLGFLGILHFLPVKSAAAAAAHRSQTFIFTGEKCSRQFVRAFDFCMLLHQQYLSFRPSEIPAPNIF